MTDFLITNGHVITMDAAFTEVADGAVAIKDGKIVGVGPASDFGDVAEIIDAKGGYIIPGLINTHCHAAMTLFRGLADDRPLDAFLQKVWAAEAAHINAETVELGATLGAAEMARAGVTHFVDMYWHFESTIAAAKTIGIGVTAGPTFIAFDGIDHMPWGARVDAAEEALARLAGKADLMVMPHACYTMDAEKLRIVADMAARHNVPVHIHAAEAPSEMAQVDQIYGVRPIEVLHDTGILQQQTLIAHAVHLNDAEIALLSNHNVTVAHCPASNAKLASGTARVRDLRNASVKVGLGTDGPSSSNDLDLWQAMRQASFLNTTLTGEADSLTARDVFAMATCDGAAAIGKAGQKGELAVGFDADVVVVDRGGLHMVPAYDPYATLVYAAGRSDVAQVFAKGQHIVRDGRLAYDMREVVSAVRQLAQLVT